MRSGKMVRVIEVQRATTVPNEYGTPVETFAKLVSLRAELVSQSTDEFLSAGTQDQTAVVFRTRYVAGITTADRVAFDGQAFNIQGIVPIGRRKGLELRCTAYEGGAS